MLIFIFSFYFFLSVIGTYILLLLFLDTTILCLIDRIALKKISEYPSME